MVGFVTLATDV